MQKNTISDQETVFSILFSNANICVKSIFQLFMFSVNITFDFDFSLRSSLFIKDSLKKTIQMFCRTLSFHACQYKKGITGRIFAFPGDSDTIVIVIVITISISIAIVIAIAMPFGSFLGPFLATSL